MWIRYTRHKYFSEPCSGGVELVTDSLQHDQFTASTFRDTYLPGDAKLSNGSGWYKVSQMYKCMFPTYCLIKHMRGIVGKPDFRLCENKGADQLRSNCEADQRLCFRYTDSTISLLLKTEISIF